MEKLQEELLRFFQTTLNPFFFLTLTLALVGVSSLLIIWKQELSKTKKNSTAPIIIGLPPGPWKLPIIGNLHQLISTGPDPIHRRLRDLAQKYGPVMHLQLGELPHVVVSSAEAAKEVLKTHDAALASRPFLLASSIIFYGCKGITFTPYGDYWRRMRRICAAELLSDKRVLSYRSIREEELSVNLVERITTTAHHHHHRHHVDLGKIVFLASNRVIARTAFGMVRENTESFMEVVNSISDLLSGLTVSDLFPSIKFLPRLTGFRAKLTALHRDADVLLEEIINEHIAKRDGEAASADHDDIIDVLLDLQENGSDQDLEAPLTIENIKAVATELFLAGSGTSSVTIEWVMSELMRNPSIIMYKAQEEVRRIFHGKEIIDEEGVEDLKYMNAVIKEALRLHPDGPLLAPRESQEDVIVNGRYLIPVKTKVLVNVWAIGRDPGCWVDPETFNPERFLHCSMDYRGRDFQFIPFGAGRRMCAGISFGMAIVELGLASLLYHFDWKLINEDIDMTERFGLTLRRNSPLCLVPTVHIPFAKEEKTVVEE